MSFEIARYVGFRVTIRHTVLFEQAMHLDAAGIAQHALDLRFRQHTTSITLDGKRFQSVPGHVCVPVCQRIQDVFGKFDRQLHDFIVQRGELTAF